MIGWEGGYGAPRPLEACLSDVERIVAQPGWVTEGPLLEWTVGLFEGADCIVWLDLPWRIAGWRIVTRHIRASLAGTNRHPGFSKLLRFLQSSREYYREPRDHEAHTRAAAASYLQPYRQKVVHCRRPVEVREFLDTYR